MKILINNERITIKISLLRITLTLLCLNLFKQVPPANLITTAPFLINMHGFYSNTAEDIPGQCPRYCNTTIKWASLPKFYVQSSFLSFMWIVASYFIPLSAAWWLFLAPSLIVLIELVTPPRGAGCCDNMPQVHIFGQYNLHRFHADKTKQATSVYIVMI